MKEQTIVKIIPLLEKVKQNKPIVHHLTNYVTVNDCANVTLAIGASPIMADDIDEVEEIVSIASALVLNIGTLNKRTITSMVTAGKKANERGIPVILDPVGAGASSLRNKAVTDIMKQIQCNVIRGNISEISFIAGMDSHTKGVDAAEADRLGGLEDVIHLADLLAQKQDCTIAVTGEVDVVSNGTQNLAIKNGHKMLGSITGTGCMCTSLIGSFCGIASDPFLGAAAGILTMGIAGEIAFEKVGQMGCGSYHMAIIDEIGKLSEETLRNRAKVE